RAEAERMRRGNGDRARRSKKRQRLSENVHSNVMEVATALPLASRGGVQLGPARNMRTQTSPKPNPSGFSRRTRMFLGFPSAPMTSETRAVPPTPRDRASAGKFR